MRGVQYGALMSGIRALLVVFAMVGMTHTQASAQDHIVREEDESFESIAQKYYAQPALAYALAIDNGMEAQSETRLEAGIRIHLPQVRQVRVRPSETWKDISKRLYFAKHRYMTLVQANPHMNKKAPQEGGLIDVPYPVRYCPSDKGTTIHELSKALNVSSTLIRKFNRLSSKVRTLNKACIFVPLRDFVFSPEGLKVLNLSTEAQRVAIEDEQRTLNTQLQALDVYRSQSDYIGIIGEAHRLLTYRSASSLQRISLYELLAHAYLALRDMKRVDDSLRHILQIDPRYELNQTKHSSLLYQALERLRASQ